MKAKIMITDLKRLTKGRYQAKVNIKAGGYDFDKVFIVNANQKITLDTFKEKLTGEVKEEVATRNNAAELKEMENKVFNLDLTEKK